MMHNKYYRQNAIPTSSEARWTKSALLIGMFFLIFSPHLNLFGLIIKTVYIFVFIPGVLGLPIFLTSYKKNKVALFCFILIIYALAYNILLSGIFGFKDYSIVEQLLMGLVTFFAANFYINKYKFRIGAFLIARGFFIRTSIKTITNTMTEFISFNKAIFNSLKETITGGEEAQKTILLIVILYHQKSFFYFYY